MAGSMRVGIGYDSHPLVAGRKLVLGGVEIPFDKGLDGWSDADVLTHAVMDALLGAIASGNIGTHFPPGDPRYKRVSSLVLLSQVRAELEEKGWKVDNIDTTIIAQKPKLKDYIDPMRQSISKTLGVKISQVSVKASTSNNLGFVGREEGMAACAVALLSSK